MRERIAHGVYAAGDRLPSIRELCREFGISMSTAQSAYGRLEDERLIEGRPKSGYYLLPRNRPVVLPEAPRPRQRPLAVSQWDQLQTLIDRPARSGVVALARGSPDLKAASLRPLTRHPAATQRHGSATRVLEYDVLGGSMELRRHVVQLAATSGCLVHPEELLITSGCQEALSIAVRTLTEPGDVIAVDSPMYYGTLQIMRGFGLEVLEIPTDARNGISLDALELAFEQWPVRAVQVAPTCNNPLGYTMPDRRKRDLLRLARRFDVAVIEDDVNGDLAFDVPRPKTVKAFDDDGRVLLCSSVSKTLAPALRVGWIAPGRYRDRAMHMKYVSTGVSGALPQLAVADFIARGRYEPHVRTMTRRYRRNRDIMMDWVKRHFPADTAVTAPSGGFVLWLQLPASVDCGHLNEQLDGVSIAPGALFSASAKYRSCMRLNYAREMTDTVAAAVKVVGEAAAMMVAQDKVEREASR